MIYYIPFAQLFIGSWKWMSHKVNWRHHL